MPMKMAAVAMNAMVVHMGFVDRNVTLARGWAYPRLGSGSTESGVVRRGDAPDLAERNLNDGAGAARAAVTITPAPRASPQACVRLPTAGATRRPHRRARPRSVEVMVDSQRPRQESHPRANTRRASRPGGLPPAPCAARTRRPALPAVARPRRTPQRRWPPHAD